MRHIQNTGDARITDIWKVHTLVERPPAEILVLSIAAQAHWHPDRTSFL